MTIIPTWMKVAALMALVGALAWGAHVFVSYEQQIGYDRRVAEDLTQENADLKAAMAETVRLNGVITEAQNAAKIREGKIATLAASNDALLGKLRVSTANVDALVSSASADALAGAVRAYGGLFTNCRERFETMGLAASGHRSDVKTLVDGWPRKKE
jgi:hypothetical protein